MDRDLLVSLDVDVDAGVNAGVEAVVAAVLEAVLAAVVLVHADVLFSAHAGGAAAVVLGDADVFAEAFFVTGRAGWLLGWWLLTFPSSALDRDVLFSLDLLGLLSILVGRRKDAERDSAARQWAGLAVCCGSSLARSLFARLVRGLLDPAPVRWEETTGQAEAAAVGRARGCACVLTGLWRRNPAWRLCGDLKALQDSNATCRTNKPDRRRMGMGVKREEGLWRQLSAGGGLDDSDARVGGDWVVDDAAATASERVGGRGVVWEMVLSGSSGLGGDGGVVGRAGEFMPARCINKPRQGSAGPGRTGRSHIATRKVNQARLPASGLPQASLRPASSTARARS